MFAIGVYEDGLYIIDIKRGNDVLHLFKGKSVSGIANLGNGLLIVGESYR